jgi:uracil-DNA glycosylase
MSALDRLRAEAGTCTACELYRAATQTVFGQGPDDAEVMLVGEQPGDQEDRTGEPFIGPAGALLDRALGDAGFDRREVYVTNAVKHFKWEARGKRRIHKRPSRSEQVACRRWLDAELEVVRPGLVVCLGAVAASAVIGPHARVGELRGTIVPTTLDAIVTVTVHPSAVLRAGRDARRAAYEGLRDALAVSRSWVEAGAPPG